MALEATGSLSKARAALAERQAVGDGEAAIGPESPALPCTDRWDVVGCRFSAPRPSPAQPGGSRGSWSWPRHSRALYPALPAGPPGLLHDQPGEETFDIFIGGTLHYILICGELMIIYRLLGFVC